MAFWNSNPVHTREIRGGRMHLVVNIPCRIDEDSSRALSLARQAPIFTMEGIGARKVASGIFPSLPTGIDLAVQLIGETVRLSGAWASVNSKRISSLARLWQRLDCYRDSLNVPDRERYCREKTAFFNTLVGCEGHRCPVSCQFICTPCMRLNQEQSFLGIENRFEVATELAEIAWCPNLNVSGPGSQAGRARFTIDLDARKG